jgi:hypothetical protein
MPPEESSSMPYIVISGPRLFHDYTLAEIIDYFYSNSFKHYVAGVRSLALRLGNYRKGVRSLERKSPRPGDPSPR